MGKLQNQKNIILIIFDIVIIYLFAIALLTQVSSLEIGLSELKYFTTISNILAFGSAIASLFVIAIKKKMTYAMQVFEYIASACMSLTFFVVVIVFFPISGDTNLFTGLNFFFHLILPLVVFAKYVLCINVYTLKAKYIAYAFIPSFVYAIGYVIYVFANNGFGIRDYDFYMIGAYGSLLTVLAVVGLYAISFGNAILMYYISKWMNKVMNKNLVA